ARSRSGCRPCWTWRCRACARRTADRLSHGRPTDRQAPPFPPGSRRDRAGMAGLRWSRAGLGLFGVNVVSDGRRLVMALALLFQRTFRAVYRVRRPAVQERVLRGPLALGHGLDSTMQRLREVTDHGDDSFPVALAP